MVRWVDRSILHGGPIELSSSQYSTVCGLVNSMPTSFHELNEGMEKKECLITPQHEKVDLISTNRLFDCIIP